MPSREVAVGSPGRPAERALLDVALAKLGDLALPFARLPPTKKAALVRACLARVRPIAERWVSAAAAAKGLTADEAAEEWADPWILMRALRLYAESLEAIALFRKPPFGRSCFTRGDGRLVAEVMPCSGYDALAYLDHKGQVLFRSGLDVAGARALQAAFYASEAESGKVALVLGAGNRAVIPLLDVLHKLIMDGEVCLLKMSPVNEWAGPILEELLAPLAEAGYVRFAYGGGDVGAYLCVHPGVDTLHMTGSTSTYDGIVWGPKGPEQDRRRRENDPLNERPFSSELGSVSPVAIVPAHYSDKELDAQVRILATSIVNNASFNCNATKVLITAHDWAQRNVFLERLTAVLESIPPRRAYYPGALERYQSLTAGRTCRVPGGKAPEGYLPWTLITDVDPKGDPEPLFVTEPFCAIVTETSLDASTPDAFLAEVAPWMNERLWGTLNAELICPPKLERDPAIAVALDRCILELEYGTVAVNIWPAVAFGLPSLPLGGYPGSTPSDIQSGHGWVHNTYLLGGVEKVILRGPIVPRPLPPWVHGRPHAVPFMSAFLRYEESPGAGAVLGLIRQAI